ncbi:uncharacterized protein CELE_F59C12.4 [Caenorhabditis elegans]|uniref:Uncharacterized protein n=1 Tax=Caenorhabditis elegans TaxID=6239 RepID=A3FPJ0_CAEEL|nr:Uncharacterized protein CELE_F59C12.4 [Caenorhabditis elegans]CCD63422.1 Uncharacterized protein CELE_F59C12.4 [Caenorhabditis elegans]|eukprot:NP_001123155.1 Uncharacterized protein CELE_F59C12.4 [Caenorhabditis elegans]
MPETPALTGEGAARGSFHKQPRRRTWAEKVNEDQANWRSTSELKWMNDK